MSKKNNKQKSARDSLQSAVWMIGIAILFLTGDWWPGILIVIATSILAEVAFQYLIPDPAEKELPAAPMPEPAPEPISAPEAAPEPTAYRTDLLPLSCPACGARVRTNEVRWRDAGAADCGYCGSPLILR